MVVAGATVVVLPSTLLEISIPLAMAIPPLLPPAPRLVMLILPPAVPVSPEPAKIPAFTAKVPLLLSTNVTEPPAPVPFPVTLVLIKAFSVKTPLVVAVLAVKLILPPLPLAPKGAVLITAFEAIVRFLPALRLIVPPSPAADPDDPPVAVNNKPESAVISPVAPVVVNDMLPPLPVVEPALALSVFVPLAASVAPLIVMLPPLEAPLPLDCAVIVAPLRVIPPAPVLVIVIAPPLPVGPPLAVILPLIVNDPPLLALTVTVPPLLEPSPLLAMLPVTTLAPDFTVTDAPGAVKFPVVIEAACRAPGDMLPAVIAPLVTASPFMPFGVTVSISILPPPPVPPVVSTCPMFMPVPD